MLRLGILLVIFFIYGCQNDVGSKGSADKSNIYELTLSDFEYLSKADKPHFEKFANEKNFYVRNDDSSYYESSTKNVDGTKNLIHRIIRNFKPFTIIEFLTTDTSYYTRFLNTIVKQGYIQDHMYTGPPVFNNEHFTINLNELHREHDIQVNISCSEKRFQ